VIPPASSTTTPPEGCRDLLHRVASAARFQKSKRLRDLLLYLGERGLQDPTCILREQEIGADVLGRPADYDTSHDTLVRVQVSHLRKKLQEHFTAEGSGEPLVIEIPKGSYVPVFRPRAEALLETVPTHSLVQPGPNAGQPLRMLLCGVAIGLAAMGLAWFFFRPVPQAGLRPTVNEFWRQLFANGQATYAVLSDVTLIEFEKLIGRPVPLPEYETHEFDRLAELYISKPVERALAREFVNRVTTSVSDVQAARDFGVLAGGLHLPLNFLSARDLSSSVISSQNTILLGSWRANPWVGLFENQMSFQTDYQETPPAMRFINRSPLPGEQPAYEAEWRRYGYCRITYLPNPKRTGNVLLISGSDVISTEAGTRFVTSEDSIRQLRQRLGLRSGTPIPHFEVLLKTQIVNNSVPWFELVASRPQKSR
jgi:hypothetical protein